MVGSNSTGDATVICRTLASTKNLYARCTGTQHTSRYVPRLQMFIVLSPSHCVYGLASYTSFLHKLLFHRTNDLKSDYVLCE